MIFVFSLKSNKLNDYCHRNSERHRRTRLLTSRFASCARQFFLRVCGKNAVLCSDSRAHRIPASNKKSCVIAFCKNKTTIFAILYRILSSRSWFRIRLFVLNYKSEKRRFVRAAAASGSHFARCFRPQLRLNRPEVTRRLCFSAGIGLHVRRTSTHIFRFSSQILTLFINHHLKTRNSYTSQPLLIEY